VSRPGSIDSRGAEASTHHRWITDKRSVVVAGSLAQRPHRGGHASVFLQYLLGFKRLGWDVLFVDVLGRDAAVDGRGRRCAPESSTGARYLRGVAERSGLGADVTLLDDAGRPVLGRSRAEVAERVRRSDLLLNVMGFLDDEQLLEHARLRVFLDIDPGFGQMWKALDLADVFAGHHAFATVGLNVGAPECTIPTCGIDWITTPPPIVLDQWPVAPSNPGGPFTSVCAWRGPFGPIEYGGTRYGLRVHELRRLAALPRRSDERFELALEIHPADGRDRELLQRNGWSLADPVAVAGTPERYREYIQRSKGELMVAKGMYVTSRSGWLSDRTAAYLASGRPVVCQDTGLRERVPEGRGLVLYSSLEEAAEGVAAVAGDYRRHARAARGIAEAVFGSDRVLGTLVERLGIA
jgi:hypothetical protein